MKTTLIILSIFFSLNLKADEEMISKKEAEKLIEELSEKIQLKFDITQQYMGHANEIFSSIRVLKLLRSSEHSNDQKISKAIEILELNLNTHLISFTTYIDSKKDVDSHKLLLGALKKAYEYRAKYPYKYEHENIKTAISKVLNYAKNEIKKK